METREYLEVLLRRKLVIVLTLLVASASATAITLTMPPVYAASATLRISPPIIGTVDYAELVYVERVVNTYIRILTSWPVMDNVSSRLDIPRAGLEGKIKIEAIRDTELIRIVVEDRDPAVAQGIAGSLTELATEQQQRLRGGRTVQDTLAEQLDTMQKELANAREMLSATQAASSGLEAVAVAASKVRTIEEIYALLLREYEQSKVRETIRANSTSIVEPAAVSPIPIRPNRQQNIGLGALLGLLAGIGLAFLAESMDKAIRTTEDLERQLKATVLGTVPEFASKPRKRSSTPQIVVGNRIAGEVVEAYRLVRANIQAFSGERARKTLLFTSAGQGEGKSTVVANLAVAAAQAKQRVVIVDADFRRPSMHKVFGVSNDAGFSQALLREQRASVLAKVTEFEGLSVLTSGPAPPNPDVVLHPASVRPVLSELVQTYDLVLVDGPPGLLVADASLIASLFDGVVVVAKSGHTTPKALHRLSTQLGCVSANVVGTILNSFKADGAEYYRKYYRPSASGTGAK
ncbi:MAG: polysaccharide biosynthesis tyrosine autokinase [Chloroflexi bacterium]|nr:polysaccharide biosynthesis tyrosine autokinase [Chloroflexota bacterium]